MLLAVSFGFWAENDTIRLTLQKLSRFKPAYHRRCSNVLATLACEAAFQNQLSRHTIHSSVDLGIAEID